MKFTRLTALALALVMALSLVTVAQAEDKPSTWISDELVELVAMDLNREVKVVSREEEMSFTFHDD